MHIAVLDTNTDDSDFGRSHPSETDKFRALMTPVAPDWRFSGYQVHRGMFPEGFAGIDGLLITGSVASVNDKKPWVRRLMNLIRSAHAENLPIFGACFGHQAVARALGGRVGPNPQGWVLGSYETANHNPAPWMDDPAPRMRLHAAHKEQVVVPPPGAQIHAGTDDVPHGHMSVGKTVFSTQYHPELSAEFMQGLCAHLRGDVDDALLDDAVASLDAGSDSQKMALWIRGFFEQARA